VKRTSGCEREARKAQDMLTRMKPLAVWAFGLNGETFRRVEKLGGPAAFYGWIAGMLNELAGPAGTECRDRPSVHP